MRLKTVTSLALLITVASCGGSADGSNDDANAAPDVNTSTEPLAMNTLSDADRAAGWRLLFDGETLDGWRGFRLDHAPDGWQVVDGAITRVARAGDLITVDQFADFELELEWMVGPAGNSGIFIRATEEVEVIYFGAPEMQVLDDDGHRDGASPLNSAGSNYDLHPAVPGVTRPAGEWNQVRIVVHGAHVEQWMNGVQMVEYELWSPEWEELVAASKFAEWPAYGRATIGHIGLQDHGDRVSFRNIRVREIR